MDKTKKILSVCLDIKHSTDILSFDTKIRAVSKLYKVTAKLVNKKGEYEITKFSRAGDSVILLADARNLEKHKLLEFLENINKAIGQFEGSQNILLKVGIGYGRYGDTQVEGNGGTEEELISYAVDYSAKGSNLALTAGISEQWVVEMKHSKSNQYMFNGDLIEALKELNADGDIIGKESKTSKNYRFDMED